jgi:hypothetical protein
VSGDRQVGSYNGDGLKNKHAGEGRGSRGLGRTERGRRGAELRRGKAPSWAAGGGGDVAKNWGWRGGDGAQAAPDLAGATAR